MLTRPNKTKRCENRSNRSSGKNSTPKRRSHPQEQPIKSTGLDSFPFPPSGPPAGQEEVRRRQNQARELLHYEQT